MKLTSILYRFKPKLPGGHLWHGKHRLYKKVQSGHLTKQRELYEMEERNMFYLRHPYLTLEQSHGHAVSFKHHEKFLAEKREQKLQWKDDKLLGDRFGFLKITDRWE